MANNGVCENRGEIKEFKTLSGLGETRFRELNQATLKDRINSRFKILVQRGLDILGIPEDAPIELIIDSYPRLGRFIQYLE